MEIFKNLFKKEDQMVTDLSILQQISRRTSFEECDNLNLFNRMRETAKNFGWTKALGLTAIQIGIDLSALYYEFDKKIIQLINPIIIEQEEKYIAKAEGCLSFPNQRIDTYRYKTLIAEADIRKFDIKTEEKIYAISKNQRFSADDLEAHIIKHEVDHLFGKTIFDNAVLIMPIKREFRKIGRNEICPLCNSGKKYKYCCIDIYEAQQNTRILESKE